MAKNWRMVSNLRDGIDAFVNRAAEGNAANIVKDTGLIWVVGVGALTEAQYAEYLESAHADYLHDLAQD